MADPTKSLIEDLRTFLVNKAAVSALVSTRIYYPPAPQAATYPFLTLFTTSETDELHLTADAGFGHSIIQVDVYALTGESAIAVKEAVRRALVMYSGTMGTHTIGSIVKLSEFESEEVDQDGTQTSVKNITMQFDFSHNYIAAQT